VQTSRQPVVEVPLLKNTDETIEFDRFLLKSNPTWPSFIRRCFPFELPPGIFEELAAHGRDVCVQVGLGGSGRLIKGLFTCSLEQLCANPKSPMELHGVMVEIHNPTTNENRRTGYENN
jgi:hypothetical protein